MAAFRPSGGRAETYAGRAAAVLLRKRQTDGQTPDRCFTHSASVIISVGLQVQCAKRLVSHATSADAYISRCSRPSCRHIDFARLNESYIHADRCIVRSSTADRASGRGGAKNVRAMGGNDSAMRQPRLEQPSLRNRHLITLASLATDYRRLHRHPSLPQPRSSR